MRRFFCATKWQADRQVVEKDIQSLNDKFIELDDLLKNEVLTKQDISTKLASSEEKIMQAQESQFIELRQILSKELKSLLHNQQQEISHEWKSQLLELRHEIKRLDFAIDDIKQQLKCTDSLKEEIEKELMPHIIPHISRRKCEKRKFKHSLFNTELSANKSDQTSQQQEISSHESIDLKKSDLNTFRSDDEIASMIADKLSQFSIEPNASKISCAQFNKIMRLLNIEKEQYSKKYDNFYELYNKLNMAADQKALNKLKIKKHHKIKFAKPLTSVKSNFNHSSFKDGLYTHEQLPPVQHRNKEFVSTKNSIPLDFKYSQKENHEIHKNKNFAFFDKGASGDAILPVFNKQSTPIANIKINSIRESDTEDIEMPKNVSATFSKSNPIVTAEQFKYERQSSKTLPVEQMKFDSVSNSYSSANFAFPERGDSNDSVLPFLNKQNIHLKHIKSSSVKQFETSSPIEDSEKSKNLISNALQPIVTIAAEHSKYKSQENCVSPKEHRKFNSAISSHTVHFKDAPVFKTMNKYNELKDYSKSDDFEDVSSLESYKFSDDDDQIVTRS